MKVFKISLVVMAGVLMTFGMGGLAAAFHDGGVAQCEGCHTMHNSFDGASNTVAGTIGDNLTRGSDPSSTCLRCHDGAGGYHINSTDGSNYKPGGDFYWLSRTFTWTAHSNTYNSFGDDHGHNVKAADFTGWTEDGTLGTAPGGSYSATVLSCISCHDPHGEVNVGTGPVAGSGSYGEADPAGAKRGNYRLLGNNDYSVGGYDFSNPAPVAAAPSFFSGSETDTNHVNYGGGMSEWCRNCHTSIGTGDMHPAGNDVGLDDLSTGANYNLYVKSGVMTGNVNSSYLQFVPFERGVTVAANRTTLAADRTTQKGPATPLSGNNVMCLTCHRAHASAFPNAGRWDFTTEFLADSHPAGTNDLSTQDEKTHSYYGRDIASEFGEYQRSFCNKCHAWDK